MTPLRWVTGGGDQENTTSLSPGTAPNISGDPDGAEERAVTRTLYRISLGKFGVASSKRPLHNTTAIDQATNVLCTFVNTFLCDYLN